MKNPNRHVNHFSSEEMNILNRRVNEYLKDRKGGLGSRRWSSYYFDDTTDIEITGAHKDAIRKCTLRSMTIPSDIIIDFMIINNLWEEEDERN